MQPSYHNTQLLIHWVQAEINYFLSTGQLANNKFLKNNPISWTELISNGFILKLFQSIHSSGFSKLLSFDAINYHDSSFQHLLSFYWNTINQFLVLNYKKEINPIYLKKQTTFKRSVYNKSEEESCESSTIELVKLLFYLLVQKENIAQKQCEMLNNNQRVETNKKEQSDGQKLSAVTQDENDQTMKSQLLARICELSQDVQQYLMRVIEQLEEQKLIRPLTPFCKSSNASYHCLSTPQSPTNNSNFRRIIFKQIEHLQEENQHLRSKIEQIIEQNNKLQIQIEENASQENNMINQINDYNQEKEELFTYLRLENGVSISTLDEFIELVRQLQNQNQSLENAIADIEERNYQLEKSNAFKLHSINQSALQITQLNQQINIFKTKIKGLKQDIEYLDQIVNYDQQDQNHHPSLNSQFNAQMVRSINVDEQAEMLFKKSVESELRHSMGNILKENHNISNQKINQISEDHTEKKTISKHSHLKMSIQDWQKSIKDKTNSNFRLFLENQENIQPSPFDEEDYIKSDIQNVSLKESQILQRSQQQEEQKEIEIQKQKYRQQLVANLQQLYKEIADLSSEVAEIKQCNNQYRKKSKFNDKKIAQLNALHQQFLKEFSAQS